MAKPQIIQADLTWQDGEFRPDIRVALSEDGLIERVGLLSDPSTLRLERQALLPGMVNAHSHAFQRALRGQGERFPAGQGSFWTWRQAMYALVEQMTAPQMFRWCVQAFTEMLRAGVTTVGEFHYLHHAAGDRYTLDDAVLSAARQTGIRLVLLLSFYKTGGVNQPLSSAQQRFGTPSTEDFWGQFDRLAGRLDPRTQSLGIAPHSIRAVPPDDLIKLVSEARRRGAVVHMHVEEQPQEIADCRSAHGVTPLELCLETLTPGPRFTAVHCTHSQPAALQRLAATGANICLCPLTEGNLGDGVSNLSAVWNSDRHFCLGSDSNARIDMFEELRWLEYVQRLTRQGRGILRDSAGRLAAPLFRCATANGARALGIHTGTIQPGSLADFFTLDLDHPTLEGWTPGTLLDSVVFGSDAGAVRRVCVGGHWIQ